MENVIFDLLSEDIISEVRLFGGQFWTSIRFL